MITRGGGGILWWVSMVGAGGDTGYVGVIVWIMKEDDGLAAGVDGGVGIGIDNAMQRRHPPRYKNKN